MFISWNWHKILSVQKTLYWPKIKTMYPRVLNLVKRDLFMGLFSWKRQDFLGVVVFKFGTFSHTSILLCETQIKLWEVLILIAGLYCISMPMKMCHLVHGLLVLKLSTLMNTVCAVEHHQVLLLKDICN